MEKNACWHITVRASLITFAPSNNIMSCRWLVLALEIGPQTDIRHGCQQLDFLSAARGLGSLPQGLHEGIINAALQQFSHGVIPLWSK